MFFFLSFVVFHVIVVVRLLPLLLLLLFDKNECSIILMGAWSTWYWWFNMVFCMLSSWTVAFEAGCQSKLCAAPVCRLCNPALDPCFLVLFWWWKFYIRFESYWFEPSHCMHACMSFLTRVICNKYDSILIELHYKVKGISTLQHIVECGKIREERKKSNNNNNNFSKQKLLGQKTIATAHNGIVHS